MEFNNRLVKFPTRRELVGELNRMLRVVFIAQGAFTQEDDRLVIDIRVQVPPTLLQRPLN